MANFDQNILIIGAGPVGLTAAVELARRGFSPRIVDAGSGPVIESRALGVNPRSLEILEPCGATAKMLERGIKLQRLNFWDWPRLIFSIPVAKLAHRHNFILALAQEQTEQILIGTLESLGQRIEWNCEMVDLRQAGSRPSVRLRTKQGEETAEPDIVIGADGAHSSVRKALGIGFRGSSYDEDFGLLDAIVTGPVDADEANVFRVETGIFAMFPVGQGRYRMVADQPDVIAAMPDRYTIKETVWESRFRISHRQVETYQQGSVFLTGDAAHIHSPVGGRGMNLGIEDAATLAWLIEQDRADEYSARRLPVGAHVLRQTNAQTKLLTSRGLLATFARRQILPRLLRRDFVLKRLLPEMAGLAAPAPEWLS